MHIFFIWLVQIEYLTNIIAQVQFTSVLISIRDETERSKINEYTNWTFVPTDSDKTMLIV